MFDFAYEAVVSFYKQQKLQGYDLADQLAGTTSDSI